MTLHTNFTSPFLPLVPARSPAAPCPLRAGSKAPGDPGPSVRKLSMETLASIQSGFTFSAWLSSCLSLCLESGSMLSSSTNCIFKSQAAVRSRALGFTGEGAYNETYNHDRRKTVTKMDMKP